MACEEIRRAISDGDRRVLRSRRIRAHLRGCSSCAAFASAIPSRRTELRALVPPIAPMAAAGVLARAMGLGSLPGAGSSSGAGSAAAVTAGKFAGASSLAKALVCTAIVVTASGGVARVIVESQHPVSRSAAVHPSRNATPNAPPRPTGSGARAQTPQIGDHEVRPSAVRTGGSAATRRAAHGAASRPTRAHTPATALAPGSVTGADALPGRTAPGHGPGLRGRGLARGHARAVPSPRRAHGVRGRPGSVPSPRRASTSRSAARARAARPQVRSRPERSPRPRGRSKPKRGSGPPLPQRHLTGSQKRPAAGRAK
jgi:hypothetical protein